MIPARVPAAQPSLHHTRRCGRHCRQAALEKRSRWAQPGDGRQPGVDEPTGRNCARTGPAGDRGAGEDRGVDLSTTRASRRKGVHSVGARQYCGRLGKTDNCQIAVTPSIANHAASLPIAYQLYLPEDWAGDEARRKKVRVPGRFRRPIRWNGFPSNGPRAKKSRRNTGFRPCPRTRPSTFSSTPPNCSSWNLI